MISVLYVDDEELLRDVTRLYLSSKGFPTDTAESGAEALEKLKYGSYDAVVSDYQMPEMDGIALLKEVRILYPDLPFILFTGRGREEVVIEAFDCGADYYLQKGGKPAPQFTELIHKIKLAVDRRRTQQDLLRKHEELSAAYQEITATEEELRRNYDDLAASRQELQESEKKLQLKLDTILSPDYDIGEEEFANIIDSREIQLMMDDFYSLTRMGIGIIDLKGRILVATGWQDVCTKFHRAFEQSCRNCIESDLYLTRNVEPGKYLAYKCKNQMWDIVTPIYIGKKHMGNLFLGQFFFEDEVPDIGMFAQQAEKFGYHKEKYLAAIERVPRWSHEKVDTLMDFYVKFMSMVSRLSYSNLKLAKSLSDLRETEKSLRESENHLLEKNAELHSAYEELASSEEELRSNIEELDESQIRLRESEKKYRDIFENMLEGFAYCKMLYDEEGDPTDFIYLNVNSAFDRIVGIKTVTNRRVTEVFPDIKETFPELFQIYGRVALTGEAESFTIDFTPIGKWLHISVYSPEKEHFVAVFEDITGHKHAEEALRESEEQLRRLLEDMPGYICSFLPGNRIIYANQAFSSITGMNKPDLIGDRFFDMMDPKNREIIQKTVEILTPDKPQKSYEESLSAPDGSKRFIEWKIRAFFDETGNVCRFLAVGTDTTDYRLAEEALAESEMQYRSVVENASEGITVVQDGVLKYLNPRALEMIQLPPEKIINQPFITFIHPDDQELVLERYTRRIKGEDVPSDYEFRVFNGEGRIIWVWISAVQIFWKGQPASLNFLTDVSERKHTEERLKASLEEKTILLRELHDRVKNNMQVISSLLSLQSKTLTDPKIKELFRESANRIKPIAFVHELLYRSEDFKHINYAEFLEKFTKYLAESYHLTPNTIAIYSDAAGVNMDITQAVPCSLIINEIVLNAIKHAFPDRKNGEIWIHLQEKSGQYILVCSDNGVGIPDRGEFDQNDSLGLQLIHGLTDQLRGNVVIKRKNGTEFLITFPK